MKHPTWSDTTLVMAERSRIEIDDCPVCCGERRDEGRRYSNDAYPSEKKELPVTD